MIMLRHLHSCANLRYAPVAGQADTYTVLELSCRGLEQHTLCNTGKACVTCRSSARPGGGADPAAAADADFDGCRAWFAEAGWSAEAFAEPSLTAVDALVDLLLKRVLASIEGKPDR
jgi:hypothetical protein